ncbi:uncharacterized protein [Triticum aestivum]|uniref:uncharacterized protein isoform X2 n=1 Tax=Triticum aestivum TaxID=4565 RepID=UPI000844C4E3|nr:uncharacterized protein LOC123085001 isoform X2 [Triticum aestivum]
MPRRFTVLVDWASCVAFYWLVVADIPKRKLTREGKEGLCTHEPHLLHPYTQPLPLLRIFCQGPLWLQQRAVKGASRMGPADFFAGSGAQGRRRRARSHANVVASREEWVGGEGGGGSRARVGSSRLIHGRVDAAWKHWKRKKPFTYLNVKYAENNLKEYIHGDDDILPVKLGDGPPSRRSLHAWN